MTLLQKIIIVILGVVAFGLGYGIIEFIYWVIARREGKQNDTI